MKIKISSVTEGFSIDVDGFAELPRKGDLIVLERFPLSSKELREFVKGDAFTVTGVLWQYDSGVRPTITVRRTKL